MVETRMRLSTLDETHITEFSNDAYNNNNYEFECIVKEPKPNRESFMRVMELCKEKSCNGMWRNVRERSKSLDISIGSFRITIFGKHYIELYFRNDTLENIPRGTWCVIHKTPEKAEYLSIGCKINLKKEIPVDPNSSEFSNILANWKRLKKSFRLKNRYSYLVEELYSVDLTAVRTGKVTNSLRESGTLSSKETYEIEVEYVPDVMNETRTEHNMQLWTEIMESILCSFRNSWKITSITQIHDVEKAYYETILQRKIGNDLTEIRDNKSRYKISPQVISLNMDRLRIMKQKALEYYVTPKSDGLRMTGFICDTGELFIFSSKSELYQPTGYIFNEEYFGSVFDGEMILNTKDGDKLADYLVFDCYYYKGKDIRSKLFNERLEHAKEIVAAVQNVHQTNLGVTPRVLLKKFIPMTTDKFHSECKECFKDIENDIYENDGLIFTPIDKVGGNSLYDKVSTKKFIKSGKEFKRLLKWKDSTFNSIDFRIRFLNEIEKPFKVGDEYVMTKFMNCSLHVTYDKDPKPFTRDDFIEEMNNTGNASISYNRHFESQFKPFDPEDDNACSIQLPIYDGQIRCKENDTWDGQKITNSDIVEMVYDKNLDSEFRWTPIRVRKDKDTPNFHKVALDIWQSYHFPVTKEIMTGEEKIPSNNDVIDTYYNNGDDTSGDSDLRRFHRLHVKHAIFENTIGKTTGKKLLDLGSGKGGDIPRYIEFDANVLGVDNSLDNLHNQNNGAYRRLLNIISGMKSKSKKRQSDNFPLDKVVFITGDVGKPFNNPSTFDLPNSDGIYKRYVIDNNIFGKNYTFDAATVFFALHYFFKDEKTLDTFLANVANNIKVGGYFGGCCYDGEIIDKKLTENDDMDLVYRDSNDSEILRIRKKYEGKLSDDSKSLGKEIHVLVQSIDMIHPEYLVNFKFFAKKLFELGFKIVPENSNNFEMYYKNQNKIVLSEGEQNASFLNRTFVFQRFSYGTETIDNNKILDDKNI